MIEVIRKYANKLMIEIFILFFLLCLSPTSLTKREQPSYHTLYTMSIRSYRVYGVLETLQNNNNNNNNTYINWKYNILASINLTSSLFVDLAMFAYSACYMMSVLF